MAAKVIVAQPLAIDSILGVPKNRVLRVGVELEGAWKALPDGTGQLEVDNSVFREARSSGFQYGELPSGPMQPAAIPKFIRKYYPHKVDATCGMHVHMSFETLFQYDLLMVPEYQETIIKYLTVWAEKEGFQPTHCIFERLSGKSLYCQKKYWPDEQVQYKSKDHDQKRHGHRYTIINYSGLHNTIEVRVLPMMETPAQAIRAVNQVIDITNACLVVLAKKDDKARGEVRLNGWDNYEEHYEEKL